VDVTEEMKEKSNNKLKLDTILRSKYLAFSLDLGNFKSDIDNYKNILFN